MADMKFERVVVPVPAPPYGPLCRASACHVHIRDLNYAAGGLY